MYIYRIHNTILARTFEMGQLLPCLPHYNNPWVMDNNCLKCHPNPSYPWTFFAVWPWPRQYNLESGHDTSLGHEQELCEILSRSNLAVWHYSLHTDFLICAIWYWPWWNYLGSWHIFGSWTTIEKYYSIWARR